MSIIRVEKNKNYTTICNVFLEDKRLSWKAKGILAYLLSRPDDWKIYKQHLKTVSKDGYDGTHTGFEELVKYGYASKKKYTIAGRWRFEYTIREIPFGNYRNGITVTENPELINTDVLSTEKLKKYNNNERLKKIKQLKNNFKIKSF